MIGWSHFRRLSLAVGATAGLVVYCYNHMRQPQPIAYTSWTNQDIPVNSCALWDSNWDCRETNKLVRPVRNDSPEEQNRYNKEEAECRTKAMRHIILVRHGEYLDEGESDETHRLTDRGRLQAKFTGKRLRDMGIKWDEVITSTMTRAEETTAIMMDAMGLDVKSSMKHCSYLREGAPIPPQPPVGHWKPEKSFFQDGARIEAAFRQYFYRASPTQKNDSYTLIIGHGNVIRYFVCRALQFPPEAWLRMNINHASLTWLTINPSGNVTIKYLGDSGFIPVNYLTNRIPRKNLKNVV